MGGVALGERVNTPEEPEQRRGTWTNYRLKKATTIICRRFFI